MSYMMEEVCALETSHLRVARKQREEERGALCLIVALEVHSRGPNFLPLIASPCRLQVGHGLWDDILASTLLLDRTIYC